MASGDDSRAPTRAATARDVDLSERSVSAMSSSLATPNRDKSSSESAGGVQRSTSRLSTVEVQEAVESVDNSRYALREEEIESAHVEHVEDQEELNTIEGINNDQNVAEGSRENTQENDKTKGQRGEEVDEEKKKAIIKYAEWLHEAGQPKDIDEALKTELNNGNVETARILISYFITANANVITTTLGIKSNFLENADKEFVVGLASSLEDEINSFKEHPSEIKTTEGDDTEDDIRGHVVDLTNCMLMLISQKNKHGKTIFDYDDLLGNNIALLDGLQNMYIGSEAAKTAKEGDDEQKHNVFDKTLAECYPGLSSLENIPFTDGSKSHPLKAIGNSGHLPLMKHPYIQMYIDLYWSSFVGYLFYIHLILHLLFLFFLTSFITSHEYNRNTTDVSPLTFSSAAPVFTEISRYVTMLLSICGLLFEAVQFRTERKKYFTHLENYVDLVVLLGAILLVLITLGIDYDTWSHGLGCFLILLSSLKAALLLSHVPCIGFSFQLLLAIIIKACMVCPVIIFFIIVFAAIFHNLLQNQEAFSHVGFSIMKVMVMIVGDIEFGSVFFDSSNENSLEVIAFIFLTIFLTIMTISVMVMLIGIAVHVISQVDLKREQSAYLSKVDLIIQYSYMFSGLGRMILDKPLLKFKTVQKDFHHYMNSLKKNHEKYTEKVNDPQAEMSDRIDNLVREVNNIKHDAIEPTRRMVENDVLGWLKLLRSDINDVKNNKFELKATLPGHHSAMRPGHESNLAPEIMTPNQPIGGSAEVGNTPENEVPSQSTGDQ